MRFLRSIFCSLLLTASALAQSVTFTQTAVNDADGTTISAVSSSQVLQVGATATSVTAPSTSGSFRFAYWTNSSYPATSYRDAWGRAMNPISFVVSGDTTAAAHYLPTTRDTDADGVPDWYEIEYYGNLFQFATDDGDGDGLTLLAEYTAGTHPLYANSHLDGDVATVDSASVTVNLAGYASYTLRSVPAGPVTQSTTIAPPGTVVTTTSLAANTAFAYWTLDGVRQQDAWGVALPQITFTMGTVNREAVAYLFTGDSDGDGIPDAYEYYYYGTLANGAASDTDGDGVSLLAEFTAGTNPLYGNSHLDGDVAIADSSSVTVDLTGFASYTLRSVPAGTVTQTTTIASPGTVVTTTSLAANTSFGYWTLDGVRQQDAWGVALPQITFTMGTVNREAVAYLFTGDSDGDGIPDAYEYYYYGTLTNDAVSDTDGDGFTLFAEYTGGTNPRYGNSHLDGDVAIADSSSVTVKLVFPVLTVPTSPVLAVATSAAGAVVTFSVTAYDAIEGVLTPTTTPVSGSVFPLGSNTVSASVSDSQGNVSTRSFQVIVSASSQSVEAWRQQYFGTTANTGNAANTANPDGDGANNLLEFAFGTNPTLADNGVITVVNGVITQRGAPTTLVANVPGGVELRAMFGRRKDYVAAGLTYTVQFSSNLVSWGNSTATPTVIASDEAVEVVTVPYPSNSQGTTFFRVHVSLAQ